MTSARENILKRIEIALEHSVAIPYPELINKAFSFQNATQTIQELFIQEFTALDGHVIICNGSVELKESVHQLAIKNNLTNIRCVTSDILEGLQLKSLPWINSRKGEEADAGLTGCECLVARTGTVVLSAAQDSGRLIPVYSPIHLIVASTKDLVFDIGDAFKLLEKKYGEALPSGIFFASGPSRTADIEKKLVLGVHGPKEVYLFLLVE